MRFLFQAHCEGTARVEELAMADKNREHFTSWEEDVDESSSLSAVYYDCCDSAVASSSQSQLSDSDVSNSGLPDLSGESGFSSLAVSRVLHFRSLKPVVDVSVIACCRIISRAFRCVVALTHHFPLAVEAAVPAVSVPALYRPASPSHHLQAPPP